MTKPFALIAATALAVVLAATYSICGLAQEAAFGFQWGDRSLPKPSEIAQEKNITALIYTRDTLPERLRDTAGIILKLCDQEGLQQVIWVSRLLSDEDARREFALTYDENARRYGQADNGKPADGSALWSSARVALFAEFVDPGSRLCQCDVRHLPS